MGWPTAARRLSGVPAEVKRCSLRPWRLEGGLQLELSELPRASSLKTYCAEWIWTSAAWPEPYLRALIEKPRQGERCDGIRSEAGSGFPCLAEFMISGSRENPIDSILPLWARIFRNVCLWQWVFIPLGPTAMEALICPEAHAPRLAHLFAISANLQSARTNNI